MLDEVKLFRERAQQYHRVTSWLLQNDLCFCSQIKISPGSTSPCNMVHPHADNSLLSHGTLHATSGSEIYHEIV